MYRHSRSSGRSNSRPGPFGAAAVVVIGLLILTACGSEKPADTTPPNGSTTTKTASPSSATPSAEPTATPLKVFTDQDLMTISSTVLKEHGGRVEDTAQARKSYALMPSPPASASASSAWAPTEPNECNVFHTSWQHEAQLDPSMGFALAEVFNLGEHGTGMILFAVRSAPREALVRADFDYSPELMVRCATFDQTVESPRGPEKFTITLLPGPAIGEKAYVAKSSWNGSSVAVGLRVLAGTVSLDLGFNQGVDMTEEEGLNMMSQIAQQFVDETKNQ